MVESGDPLISSDEEENLLDTLNEGFENVPEEETLNQNNTTGLIPAVAEEEMNEDIDAFGLMTLLKTILARNTMPHILLLVITTFALSMLSNNSAEGSSTVAAMGFISLAVAYSVVALLSRSESMKGVLHTNSFSVDEGGDKTFSLLLIHKIKQIAKVWSLPLVTTGAILMLMMVLFGEEGPLAIVGTNLPIILGSLFVAWSIGQGISFRTSISTLIEEKVADKSSEVNTPAFWPVAITMMIANLLIGIILIMLFSSIQDKELATSLDQASASVGGHILFLALILISQGGLLWWSKELIETASSNKKSNAFSLRWGIAVQAFATWHLMSVYRQNMMVSPSTFTTIEEGLLMILTVLLAIWAITTKGIAKENSIFTRDNALFWGLAFGFGYAGSIAMVANVMGDVKGVLIAGHLITWITLQLLHRAALKDHLTSMGHITPNSTQGNAEVSEGVDENGSKDKDESTEETDGIAESEVNNSVNDVEHNENNDTTADNGDSIGDDKGVDWSNNIPEPITSGVDWDDNEEGGLQTSSNASEESESQLDDDLELLD